MFRFIFGILWCLFMLFATWCFYFGNGNITVGGQAVSQQEFNAMLFPKVFIGIF